MSADWWQNFANNFAADLAPLLSLFGEQPTKQYLSETLTFIDIVIFSIAPIGVLTAVVSAIRVSEDPSLRAFIGRAQEGGAYAEAELCSSTSRDVCELYTTGGIARVFGRPKILEVVHDQSKEENPEKAGIYTFKEYCELHEQTEWIEKKKRRESESATEESFAEHPNLSLNIGIKKLPRPWFYFVAALGLLLQGGVLVFAALATYVYPRIFKRDDTQIAVPAFPFTFAGTFLLCTGVGLCATVVERSTKERTFKRNGSECRLHWIQPGGQVIGDQVFDSFAYSETSKTLLKEYTTSWKPNERTSKRTSEQATKETLLVWAAIITTCAGFVLQFLGMRTLHSSVSVAQFVVMLVMSTLRALLRTQRLDKSDNQMGDSYTLYQGHELDWLAINLACEEKDRDDRRWTWQIGQSFEEFSYRAVDLSQNAEASRIHGPSAHPGSELERAFLKRARLARLTGAISPNFSSIAYSSWDQTMIASRELASSLAKAIEGTMAILYGECTIKSSWKSATKIRWSMPCSKNAIGEILGSQTGMATESDYLSFTLSRQPESTESFWKADKSELEAALGLWLWSIRSKNRIKSSDGRDPGETSRNSIPCFRIALSGFWISSATESEINSTEDSTSLAETASSSRNDWSAAEASFKLWWGSRRLALRRISLEVQPKSFGPGTIVTPLEEHEKTLNFEQFPGDEKEQTTEPKPRRLFGQHMLPDNPGTKIHVLEMPVESSLEMLYAQEIFSAFLKSLLPILHQIGGKTSIIQGSDRLHLENQTLSNMIRSFATSGIGSEKDALTCIVPILLVHDKLVPSVAFIESIDAVDIYRKRNEWVKAEQILLCALTLSSQARETHYFALYDLNADIDYTKDQNMCLIALCELYRWALLGNGYARVFGLRGMLSICKTHDVTRCSKEVVEYLNMASALCHRNDDDLVVRKLSEELQVEIETGKMSPVFYQGAQSDLTSYCDKDFPLVMEKGDLGATLYLLKDKVISICRGPPALALAARNGWVTVLKALLELGADPEEIDRDGLNYMHYASQCIRNPEDFLQLVVNQDYLLNRMDKRGRTSLHLAAESYNQEIAVILVDQFYLDPHQWDLSMESSFEYALSEDAVFLLDFMVRSMVQRLGLSSNNLMWDTLMQIAILVATSGPSLCLNYFLECKDFQEDETLNEDITKVLEGLQGTCATLLSKFTQERCFDFDFLQSTFYDHFGHDRMFSTGIALSCTAKINDIPLVPLLKNPQKITSLDGAGRSCLHYAIKGGNTTRIQQLLNADLGVGINVKDKTGRTPLAYAFRNGNLALTTLLREYGAGVHKLPLQGSAITAQDVDDYHLYFQDESLRIRELVINREGDGKADLSSEIAVAKVFTPLAIIRGDDHEREVHVYCISKENYICDTINNGRQWLTSSLSHKKIEVHPQSGLAAIRTDAGELRVFYQDPSGDLTEIQSIDGKKWGSPTKIRKVPVGTTFTALTTPEGTTRIIFQGEDCPEEVYETYTENHTEWNGRVFVKIAFGQERFRRILSIAAPSQPSRKVFWLDDRDDMHETTLTDDDCWEDSLNVVLVDAARFFEQIRSEMTYKIRRPLAVIGSEPILFYQKRDGTFCGISSYDTSWRKERMAIPAYDN